MSTQSRVSKSRLSGKSKKVDALDAARRVLGNGNNGNGQTQGKSEPAGNQQEDLLLELLTGEAAPTPSPKSTPKAVNRKRLQYPECDPDPATISDTLISKPIVATTGRVKVWLGSAAPNRAVNWRRVHQWFSVMERGEWNPEHPQGLVWDKDGHLIEGQHRLLAFMKWATDNDGNLDTRKKLGFWATFGADRKVQRDLDSGQGRTIAQTGQILNLQTSSMGVSITKGLWINPEKEHTKIPRITDVELVLSIYEKYQDGINFACKKFANRGSIGVAAVRSVLARAYYHCGGHNDVARLLRFIEVLDTGLSESKDEVPAALVRNTYLTMGRRGEQGNLELYRKTMYAVSCYLKHTEIKALKQSYKQLFPLEGFDD